MLAGLLECYDLMNLELFQTSFMVMETATSFEAECSNVALILSTILVKHFLVRELQLAKPAEQVSSMYEKRDLFPTLDNSYQDRTFESWSNEINNS